MGLLARWVELHGDQLRVSAPFGRGEVAYPDAPPQWETPSTHDRAVLERAMAVGPPAGQQPLLGHFLGQPLYLLTDVAQHRVCTPSGQQTLVCACVEFPRCQGFVVINDDHDCRVLLVHDGDWAEAEQDLQAWLSTVDRAAFLDCTTHLSRNIWRLGGLSHGLSFLRFDLDEGAKDPRKRLRGDEQA